VFAPSLTPDFVKRAIFKDTGGGAGFEKWKAKGDFNLATADNVDASTETVRLILNQGTGPALFDGSLPPGSFALKGSATTKKWKFSDKEGDVPSALGWQKAKLILKLNKLRHVVKGQGPSLPIDTTAPIRIRHTLRIGDTCSTGVVSCTPNGTGSALKCSTIVFGSASGAFLD
jgi:hypothetical protein